MFSIELKIPKERIAILIGTKGETKKLIENKAKVNLKVSSTGDIIISSDDGLKNYITCSVITAIGRGFNPQTALKLLNEDYCLEIINFKDFAKNSKKYLIRIKSRVIGTKGKAKRNIENLTDTEIVIYGKTISIIGKIENTLLAKQAIERLISGSPHGNVYKFINRLKSK